MQMGPGSLASAQFDAVLQYALKRRERVRAFWFSRWEELAEFFHPDREGFTSEKLEGDERRDETYGSPPELAARSLTSHIATALRRLAACGSRRSRRTPG